METVTMRMNYPEREVAAIAVQLLEPEERAHVQQLAALIDRPVWHVCDGACIRVYKELLVLHAMGIDCQPIARRYGAPDLMLALGAVYHYRNQRELEATLSHLPDEFLLHVHVEPAGIAATVRGIKPGATIVLDVHDADWGRGLQPKSLEIDDAVAADGVVVPSLRYAEIGEQLLRTLPGLARAIDVVRSCTIGPPAPDRSGPRLGGVYYQGGVDVGGWRDYRELFDAMRMVGVQVYAYAPEAPIVAADYADCGAVLRVLPYRNLLAAISRHDWSLVCPPRDGCSAWSSAMPNKFYEAMWAGTPILTYGCEEVAREVRSYRLGYVFGSRAELLEAAPGLCQMGGSDAHDELRASCRAYAMAHRMETQLPALLTAYAQAISRRDAIARQAKLALTEATA